MIDFKKLDRDRKLVVSYGVFNPKKISKLELVIQFLVYLAFLSAFFYFGFAKNTSNNMLSITIILFSLGLVVSLGFIAVLVDKYYREKAYNKFKFASVFLIVIGLILLAVGFKKIVYDGLGVIRFDFVYLLPAFLIVRVIFELSSLKNATNFK